MVATVLMALKRPLSGRSAIARRGSRGQQNSAPGLRSARSERPSGGAVGNGNPHELGVPEGVRECFPCLRPVASLICEVSKVALMEGRMCTMRFGQGITKQRFAPQPRHWSPAP